MNNNPLDMRGTANIRAKLSGNQVLQIRTMYRSGNVTQEYIGKKFGVGKWQISRIISGKRWNHLPQKLPQ